MRGFVPPVVVEAWAGCGVVVVVEDAGGEVISAPIATLLLNFSRQHVPHEHVPPASGVTARKRINTSKDLTWIAKFQ